MLQWFSKEKRKGVAWLILFLMCLMLFDVPMKGKAGGNGLVGEFLDDNNVLNLYGRHDFTDGELWTYYTTGFNVATGVCSDITNPPAGVKTARLNINSNLSAWESLGGNEYTNSTYTMSGQEFANVFQMLYQDEINDAVAKGQKSYTNNMYFNNIFRVVYRTDSGKTDKPDGTVSMVPQYSFISPEEYHTAHAIANNPYVSVWSAETFAGFYNYSYPFTVNILETQISYVDKKTGTVLNSSAAKVYGLKNGTGRYTLLEKEITVEETDYIYDGTYTIDYKNGSTPVTAPSTDGSVSWTIQKDGMEVILYFVQDENKKEVPLKLHTEITDNETMYRTIRTEDKGTVKEGESFSYIAPETYSDGEKDYFYTKVWCYTYTDLKGSVRTVEGMSEQPEISSVPRVKKGTGIDIYIRYERMPVRIQVKIVTSIKDSGNTYRNVKTQTYPGTFLPGDSFYYVAPLSYTEGGKDYAYEYEWKYNYTDEAGNLQSVPGTGHPSVSELPQIKKNTYVTVYMKYKGGMKPVKVKIHTCISEDGVNYSVEKSEDYAGLLKEGDSFSFATPQNYRKNGKNYKYTEKWYYRYIDKNGVSRRVVGAAGHPVIDTIPRVKEDTCIDLYLKYDRIAEPTGTPTPSVTPSVTPTMTKTPVPSLSPSATPSATPPPSPSPTPSPTPMPTQQPSSDQGAPVNRGVISRVLPVPTSVAVIEAEEKFGHRFEVAKGVATQEELYVEGTATEFMLEYRLCHVTGTKSYPIQVQKTYILQWGDATGSEIFKEEVTVSTCVYVTRGYGYWEIENFGYYIPESMQIANYALPSGNVTVPVVSSRLNLPTASVSDYYENIDAPDSYKYGITLPTETIKSGNELKPLVPRAAFYILAYNAAHSQTSNIRVRNDYLRYDGSTVLNSSWSGYDSSDVNSSPLNNYKGETKSGLFYQGNLVIDAAKNNGVYFSGGSVNYAASPVSVGAEAFKSYTLSHAPNDVTIHTPVYCEGVISADNETYVQLIQPNDAAVHLVLDEDGTLNDFSVRVNNCGTHITATGYGTRDYGKILRLPDSELSNIEKDEYGNLRNEVKFPFDTYIDVGNDYKAENDLYCTAGTWVTLDRISQRFYLPLTVKEGVYSAAFRTIAVNANGRLNKAQINANTDRNNYVATDTVLIEVSGRVYGLSLYDINDYPFWEEVFRIPNTLHYKVNNQERYPLGVDNAKYSSDKSYDYTVGTKDRYGNETGRIEKFTLPLVSGSHPRYGNLGILKRGYSVRFTLDTIGTYYDDTASVVAYPAYYWLDKEGKNRTRVDMYYTAEVQGKTQRLIQCGGPIDLSNIAVRRPGDRKTMGIPEEELNITAAIQRLLTWKWGWEWGNLMYGASKVSMTYQFRTFTGKRYADSVLAGPNKFKIKDAGITEENLIVMKQSWYGEAYIPGNARFVPVGTDVHGYAARHGIDYTESFWKKDGYIIMSLDIKVHDKEGKARLSYVNKANEERYCNMWRMEGAPVGKSDSGTALYFEDGDFMIYSVEQSATDDYVTGGIY